MDDSASIISSPREEPDADDLDLWLKTWFQLTLAEPVPPGFIDLIDQLEGRCGR